MKKISFVQVNFPQGPKELNAYYLPYSAGVIWSYLSQFDSIKNNFKLQHLIWKRDDLSNVLPLIQDNDVVGFSTYVWNKNYNYTLARKLREKNKDVKIIFGGPEPAHTKPDFFDTHPYIDIVIKQEGEITFKHILENINNLEELTKIPGLIINDNGTKIDTGQGQRINGLDEIPSPYLTGVFDKIMAENPDVEWNMTLETDRGCPYHCTFCDWGSLTYSKVKQFGLERVFDEIEWAGKNKVGFISITNANFGIFPERDSMIADKIIETQTKYNGHPRTFNAAWAKNQKREVIDIVKKLMNSPNGKNQGLTVSVQSLNVDVLENIKRKNLGINNMEEVFRMCNEANVPLYTETILGLPGETLETWKTTFWQLFESGNHTGVTIFQLQILENTEMNLVQKKLFKIEHSTVYDYIAGSHNEKELMEGINIVVSTKDMPHERMLDAQVFNTFLMTFHINGLTNFISQFLRKQYDVSYAEFYDKLQKFVEQDPYFSRLHTETRSYYANWMKKGRADHPDVEGIEMHGYNLLHRHTIYIHAEEKYDYVSNVLRDFLKKEYSNVPDNLLEQLLDFQKSYTIQYNDLKKYPKILNYDYNFYGYLTFGHDLVCPTVYSFIFNDDHEISKQKFLSNIYFMRRRNYGKAEIKKIN